MVVPMVRCPPDGALLCRGGPEETQHKLEPPARLVATVRKISMINAGDREHARYVQRPTYCQSCPAKAYPENSDAAEVNTPEEELFENIHGVKRVVLGAHVFTKFSISGANCKPI